MKQFRIALLFASVAFSTAAFADFKTADVGFKAPSINGKANLTVAELGATNKPGTLHSSMASA